MPVISVVIPAYNAETTILETIRSVQSQTFSDYEIIVINDGSTDQTLELLWTVEEPRLKVFSYENGGLPVARNRGIERAVGEYIAFIDADDLWKPNKLELQLAALQQQPESGVAYSWTKFINNKGNFLYAQKPIFFEGNVYPQLLVFNFVASGSNILVRREVIETVGKYDPYLKSAEDWDFNIRLAAHYPFALVPQYQIFYRKSSGAMSSKVDIMEKENLIVIERAFQKAPVELQFLKKQSLSNTYKFFTQLNLEYLHSKDGTRQASEKFKKSIQLYPLSIINLKTIRLIIKLVLFQLLPNKAANCLIQLVNKKLLNRSNTKAIVVGY